MTSKFKEQLIELDKLMKDAKTSVFRRAQLIVLLVRDQEYWSHLHTEDEGEVRRKLCRYIAELAFNVDDLIVMLDFAPDQATWDSTPLRDLRDAAYANRVQRGGQKRERPKSTLIESLRKQLTEARELIGVLRKENRNLKHRLKVVEKAIGA